MTPSASKVFISYNRADRDWAEWIAGVIKGAGYEPMPMCGISALGGELEPFQ
jgi:hypothetical protein